MIRAYADTSANIDARFLANTGKIRAQGPTGVLANSPANPKTSPMLPMPVKDMSCSTVSPDFGRDDDVRLIHQRPDADVPDHEGYLVGLDGERKGKYAGVWTVSEDDERSQDSDHTPAD